MPMEEEGKSSAKHPQEFAIVLCSSTFLAHSASPRPSIHEDIWLLWISSQSLYRPNPTVLKVKF
ncbi:MAG: hypothetical protein IRD7MM_06755 [Candidatus Midichloria mitochondrii]